MKKLSRMLQAALWGCAAVLGGIVAGLHDYRFDFKKGMEEKASGPLHTKQFMLEEMYRQWKEMLQDPSGEIPVQEGFQSWKTAGRYMLEQKQGIRLNSFSTLNWASRGPLDVGGRTRTLLVSPNDPSGNTVFAGSVGGGLWKCSNMKSELPVWTPVNDFMENLSVSCLAYDPANTQVWYAGTGEGFNSADAARGLGIMRSADGGNSWSFLPATQNSAFYYVNKIVVGSSGVIIAATNMGIRRSADGGTTWSNVLGGTYGDLERASNGVVYAASKTGGGGVYRSADNGLTWVQCTNGLPAGLTGLSRYEIAVSPADTGRLYVAVYHAGIGESLFYQSSDGGNSFTATARPADADATIPAKDFTRGQGWYDLILQADPNNAQIVYAGGINLFKSTDGGATWKQISHWYGGFSLQYLHADQHDIQFEPGNSNILYVTNDGGVYQSINGTSALPALNAKNNGYNVTQFYACAMHPDAGSHVFLAGAQDNGTQRFSQAGMGTTVMVSGGDGAFCHIDDQNPVYMFSQYVYNNYYRSINSGNSFSGVANSFANTGRFINPSTYDDAAKVMYSATTAGRLLRWKNAPTQSVFEQITVSAMGSQMISALTVSAAVANRLYVGVGNGQIIELDNAGTVTGTVAGRSLGTPAGGYVNSIWTDPADAQHLVVVYSGFGITNIWETNNALAATPTWVAKDGNLPNMPVFATLPNPANIAGSVLIATEYGVWSTDNFNDASPSWTISSKGMARVRVTQLHYRASDKTILASTYGRGLFTATLPVPVSCAAPSGLMASGISATAATVSWDAVPGAVSYDVEFKTSSAADWIRAVSGTTALQHTLQPLTAGTGYQWRVRANCSSGTSSFSEAAFSTAQACGQVSGLTTDQITYQSARLNWNSMGNGTTYQADYKTVGDAVWTSTGSMLSANSINISNLTPATGYQWRVRAVCSAGDTGIYAISQFSTSAMPVCTDIYESNNSFSASKTITPGINVEAGIGSASDIDWFKFSVGNTSSTHIRITLSQLPADYDVFLHNRNMTLIGSATTTGTGNETIIFNTTAKKTTYYIRVAGKNGAFSTAFCYRLLAETAAVPWSGSPALPTSVESEDTFRPLFYPNPAIQQVFLQFHSLNNGMRVIRLRNASGMVVKNMPVQVFTGKQVLSIPVLGLPAGMYIAELLENGKTMFTGKFMVSGK